MIKATKTSHPREHSTWKSMWRRCTDPKYRAYGQYGAKGVRVCEEWRSFTQFVVDMGYRPDGMSIDRINGAGNYEPVNCRWATPSQQAINRRVRHATLASYRRGCRCEECVHYVTVVIPAKVDHGKSGYSRGCRCETCSEENRLHSLALARRSNDESRKNAINIRRTWTREDLELVASGDFNTDELSKKLGRTKAAIRGMRRKLLSGDRSAVDILDGTRVRAPRNPRIPPAATVKSGTAFRKYWTRSVKKRYLNGESLTEIAHVTGISRSSVRLLLLAAKVQMRPTGGSRPKPKPVSKASTAEQPTPARLEPQPRPLTRNERIVRVGQGISGTQEYRIWTAMIERCSNPDDLHYNTHGGRGVRVCWRWLEFANFYRDMGPRPGGSVLERIDEHKGFDPSNCRWVTP